MAFAPGRGVKDALREVDRLLGDGYRFAVDADLKSYFGTIPHGKLMERVREHAADGRVLKLIESFLAQGVSEGLREWTPMAGSPRGAVVSPLLSNIYLNPLDPQMATGGYRMARCADDFVIPCRSRREAEAAPAAVKNRVVENDLTLHLTRRASRTRRKTPLSFWDSASSAAAGGHAGRVWKN